MLVTGLRGHLSRCAAVCRGMTSCLWETCGETPSGPGLVGFLWGGRAAPQLDVVDAGVVQDRREAVRVPDQVGRWTWRHRCRSSRWERSAFANSPLHSYAIVTRRFPEPR